MVSTFPGMSVHRGEQGYFVAFGFRKAEHDSPETFRISPYYSDADAATQAYSEKAREYRNAVAGTVLDILKRDNITEPGGEWSAYDVARVLDPGARDPQHMFDTGPDTVPAPEFVALVSEVLAELHVSKRYVGGTSRYLYSA